MIGKTNAQTSASGGIKGEKVNIFLKTNQSSHEDLKGAIITVSYATVVEEYIWSGNGITVEIPPYINYSVYVSSVEGYASPASFSSTSVPENSKSVELEYKTEIVSVTLSADDGSSVYGASVTINEKNYTWDGNAITQKVAFGVSYNVNVGALNGFSQPSSQSFTACQALREVSFVYVASALKVNILSNQENDSNIAEVKATITYGDTTLEVASGEQVGIPTDTDVTITYPEVEGYKTPEAETFRNNNGGVAQKTGTYYTEIVYISTYADEGTPTGFVTTVTRSDGAVLGSFTTGMGIIVIPSGTTYTVSCSDVDGFETPSSKTYTADSVTNARRDISMGYKKIKSETLTVNVNADDNSSVDGQYVTVVGKPIVDNGVYIQDTEGKLWTEASWDGSKTPNGIAVVTSECQFVMALKDTSNSTLYWGGNGVKIEGISSPNTASDANADYNGASNTDIIIKSLNGVTDSYSTGAPAAESCRNFIFPNGQKGYLGACGEWRAIYVNLSAVTSALSKCDGDALKADYSSSTQRYSTQYWYMRLRGTYTDTGSSTKSSPQYVRAFAPLETTETQPVSGGKATFKIPYDTEYTVSVDEKSGYTSPASQTYTASQATRTISMTYEAPKNETLTVNVSASDGSSVDGQVVTVKQQGIANVVYIEVINGKATFTIPNGVTYEVSVSDKDGYATPASQTFTAVGGTRTVSMQYIVIPVTDLSKFDIYGNAISQTTANCYVVGKADTYKIPLVFGNALKNGATNSAAYTNNGGSYSHNFVDYNGTVVTSPYIEAVSGTASSAQLSIADTDGIFTDISIVDGSPCRYLQFKVNSIPATGANGVLSIKDSSGVIMWSWHIWVWADSLATVEITNSTSVKYKILPVNLASKWDNTAKTRIKNWYYQFGRPNPMLCPSAYNSTSNHASYGALSYAAKSIASDIQTGIKNPATFYKYSSSYNNNWFQTNSGKTYNLWDAACTSTGNSDNNVVKTIYDPSPIGFKMPNGNTFTGFSIINNANGIVKCTRYSGDSTGVVFPLSGYRTHSDGSLIYVGSRGYVWLSSAYSQNDAYYLRFYLSNVNPQSSSRAYGVSVRPVQE